MTLPLTFEELILLSIAFAAAGVFLTVLLGSDWDEPDEKD